MRKYLIALFALLFVFGLLDISYGKNPFVRTSKSDAGAKKATARALIADDDADAPDYGKKN